jgi:hypothetical protein
MNSLKTRFPRYSTLLQLYPQHYRKQYADQMLQTLADMLDGAPTRTQKANIWLRIAFDFPISLSKQQLNYAGENMTQQTPQYVKRNAEIGAFLIAPFFVIIIANSLSNHLLGNTSSLRDILRFLIIGLPAIAFVLNAGTFMKWAAERRAKEKVSVLRSLFDFKRNWPMLLVAGVGLLIVAFIFGHDSVHCFTDSPSHALSHLQSTWHCTQQD